jgi:hypothetical protein
VTGHSIPEVVTTSTKPTEVADVTSGGLSGEDYAAFPRWVGG